MVNRHRLIWVIQLSARRSVSPRRAEDPQVPPACTVTYSLGNSSNGAMQANVILTDTGTSPLNGWTLTWTFPGGTKITNMWAGSLVSPTMRDARSPWPQGR